MKYRELKVWQKAHRVTLAVYRVTREWPKEELYGLASQVRRAAVSVEANLAEGQARTGSAEFGRFVHMARGSTAELDCELLIARDLGYLTAEAHDALASEINEVMAMLTALASKLSPLASRPSSGAQR